MTNPARPPLNEPVVDQNRRYLVQPTLRTGEWYATPFLCYPEWNLRQGGYPRWPIDLYDHENGSYVNEGRYDCGVRIAGEASGAMYDAKDCDSILGGE